MSAQKTQHVGKKQIFSNPALEYLTRTHIAVPLTIFYGFSIFMLGYGLLETPLSTLIQVGLFLLGFLLFTLVEYLVHKDVFHMEATTEFRKKVRYNFHGVH
ncbi:MAG: fatty acid hydroxylase, partial [Bacteroidota bacterium]